MIVQQWWKFAVLRGEGIPAELDGRWYDLDEMHFTGLPYAGPTATLEPTNQWEQRDDGAVAVVYEWRNR